MPMAMANSVPASACRSLTPVIASPDTQTSSCRKPCEPGETDILKRIHGAITSKKIQMTEEEAAAKALAESGRPLQQPLRQGPKLEKDTHSCMSAIDSTSQIQVSVVGVAVGMPVTRHPPHRSVRALLTHTAPTSSQTRQRCRCM
jgi:hypothetical protein